MHNVIAAFRHWCAENNVPMDGVAVTITFPTFEGQHRARSAFQKELDQLALNRAGPRLLDSVTHMGVKLDFATRTKP